MFEVLRNFTEFGFFVLILLVYQIINLVNHYTQPWLLSLNAKSEGNVDLTLKYAKCAVWLETFNVTFLIASGLFLHRVYLLRTGNVELEFYAYFIFAVLSTILGYAIAMPIREVAERFFWRNTPLPDRYCSWHGRMVGALGSTCFVYLYYLTIA